MSTRTGFVVYKDVDFEKDILHLCTVISSTRIKSCLYLLYKIVEYNGCVLQFCTVNIYKFEVVYSKIS